jgi:1,4-dihydroxy-2-naphthoate octaprenyltransferase
MGDNKVQWWKPGIVIFTKVSVSIAIPILIALFVGKYLDAKYHTEPWIFLGLTAAAFIISLISIWNNLSDYMKKLEKEELDKKQL